jgi:hypothetical protein
MQPQFPLQLLRGVIRSVFDQGASLCGPILLPDSLLSVERHFDKKENSGVLNAIQPRRANVVASIQCFPFGMETTNMHSPVAVAGLHQKGSVARYRGAQEKAWYYAE